jgi:hypothetical protein
MCNVNVVLLVFYLPYHDIKSWWVYVETRGYRVASVGNLSPAMGARN